jgi:hypothetical protein
MTILIKYIGGSHVRTVTAADFALRGITHPTVSWTSISNYLQPVSDAAGVFLMGQPDFVDNAGLTFENYVGAAAGTGKQEWVFELSAGAAAVTTGTEGFTIPYAVTLIKAYVTAQTAPTGASLIADLRRDAGAGAATVFAATKPTLTAGTKTSASVTPTITSLPAGTTLYRDITQIGSTVAGAGVYLWVQYGG